MVQSASKLLSEAKMKRLLNFSELRVMLGNRSRSSVYRDLDAGRLPAPVRIGGRLYWRESDLSKFVEELSDAP